MNARDAIKNIFVLLLSLFFLIFGLDILVGCFKMKNPLEFVMTIFSSSFIILLACAGILYAYFRLFRKKSNDEVQEEHAKKP